MLKAKLLCSCTDRTGIVSALTAFVAEYAGNIIDLDQHSEEDTGRFFMRLVWDISSSRLGKEEIPGAIALVAKKFDDMRWALSFGDEAARVAIFCSKTRHCLYDLLLRKQLGEMGNCEIAAVISNHENLRNVTEHFGVQFYHVPVAEADRGEAEQRQREILRANNVDLVVLARYMRILSPEFTADYENRVINIHHSFLPAFVGANPYAQARQRGVKIIGATAHYVTPALDQGPIIAQDVMHVSHRDAVADLVRKGRDVERQVLSKAVRLHLARRILVDGNRTIVFE
jgi:formyltetrahydrofolate deformylase